MNWKFPQSRILIFSKTPIAGTVKTRLMPFLSAQQACLTYEALLENTVRIAVESQVAPVELVCAPDPDHPFFRELAERYSISFSLQKGKDLGDRMRVAIQETLEITQSVVLIGGDCPVIETDQLVSAMTALQTGDFVISPTEDGGYALIGAKQHFPDIFSDITWGSDEVLLLTIARLTKANRRVTQLPIVWDVDDPTDLVRCLQLPNFKELRKTLISLKKQDDTILKIN